MRKLVVTSIVGALAATGGWLLPARATTGQNACPATGVSPGAQGGVSVQGPGGAVCASGDAGTRSGHVWATADNSNPAPLTGYISASNDGQGPQGVCTNSSGQPVSGPNNTADPNATCVRP